MMAETKLSIAGNPVINITGDSAQVGCTTVTRAEVQELLDKMDEHEKNFEIEKKMFDANFLSFIIRHNGTGWVSASPNQEEKYFLYGNKSAAFCLLLAQAEKLLGFLVKNLGYTAYKLSAQPEPEDRYIIEYNFKGGVWARSRHFRTRGEYGREEAKRLAAEEEKRIGDGYCYRAVLV